MRNRPHARKRSTRFPTSPDTTSMLWPWRTSARPAMPSTEVSSTRTTPSFGPGSAPNARPSPMGSVPATTPSGAPRVQRAARSSHSERHAPIIQRPSRARPNLRPARQPRTGAPSSSTVGGDLGMAVQHVEDEKPPRLWPTKPVLPGKARERLDVRIMRSAPMVGKDVHFVPVLCSRERSAIAAAGTKARERGPHGAASSTLAVARENRARPHDGLFIRDQVAVGECEARAECAGSRLVIRSSRRCVRRRRSRPRGAR